MQTSMAPGGVQESSKGGVASSQYDKKKSCVGNRIHENWLSLLYIIGPSCFQEASSNFYFELCWTTFDTWLVFLFLSSAFTDD